MPKDRLPKDRAIRILQNIPNIEHLTDEELKKSIPLPILVAALYLTTDRPLPKDETYIDHLRTVPLDIERVAQRSHLSPGSPFAQALLRRFLLEIESPSDTSDYETQLQTILENPQQKGKPRSKPEKEKIVRQSDETLIRFILTRYFNRTQRRTKLTQDELTDECRRIRNNRALAKTMLMFPGMTPSDLEHQTKLFLEAVERYLSGIDKM